mgnify:CR=1 FL=1
MLHRKFFILALLLVTHSSFAAYTRPLEGYSTAELLESLLLGALVCAAIVWCFFKWK